MALNLMKTERKTRFWKNISDIPMVNGYNTHSLSLIILFKSFITGDDFDIKITNNDLKSIPTVFLEQRITTNKIAVWSW